MMTITNKYAAQAAKHLSVLVLLGELLVLSDVQAQVLPDRTLGIDQSRVTSINSQRDLIEGGTQRGANLFHSFQQFNIREDHAVYFVNPQGIETIFSRVTGNDASQLFGTLGVAGNANLFFLNPNGIVFGPNARLDIAGSFLASTANRFEFGDGSEFSASQPQAAPLLMVNVPIGLQYGGNPTAVIQNSGRLVAGQDLTLLAGRLELTGQIAADRHLTLQAQENVTIRDRFNSPFLAAAGGDLLVQGNQAIDIFALNHPESELLSGKDLILRSENPVFGDAQYVSGGDFQIQKLDGRLGDLLSIEVPIIRALEDVSFSTFEGNSLHILAGGQVDINTLVITGNEVTDANIKPMVTPNLERVILSNGTSLEIDSSTQSVVDIRAGVDPSKIGDFQSLKENNFELLLSPPENSLVATSGDLSIGDIVLIEPGLVFLTTQYAPNTRLPEGNIKVTGTGIYGYGIDARGYEGNGSPVILDARGEISVEGGTIDASSIAGGNGGDVTLLAQDNITLNQGTGIFSHGLLGGSISITSTGEISLVEGLITNITLMGEANTTGGNIDIVADSLSLNNGAVILTETRGPGNAGSIQINAQRTVTLDGGNTPFSAIGNQTFPGASGSVGGITINTNSLVLNNGGTVASFIHGDGDGGAIQINAHETVSLIGEGTSGTTSNLSNTVFPGANGSAGDLIINTSLLSIDSGSTISTITAGNGDAGDVQISASDSILLAGENSVGQGSQITSHVFLDATGSSGNISIFTGSLYLNDGAMINASSSGFGNAGSIQISAHELISLSGTNSANTNFAIKNGIVMNPVGSVITSDVGQDINDSDRSIEIMTGMLSLRDNATISSTVHGQGRAGTIIIDAEHTISLDSNSDIFSFLNPDTIGSPGFVQINTGSLFIKDESSIFASTLGIGDAGLIRITANDTVSLSEGGGIYSAVSPGAIGSSEGIEITTDSLILQNDSTILSSTGGHGDAGLIKITASGTISLVGEGSQSSTILSQVFLGATGNSDGIDIMAGSLVVNDGSFISTSSFADGDAGNINITAIEKISLSGIDPMHEISGIFSQANAEAMGSSGSITIDTGTLSLANGSVVSTSTSSLGNAGSITIQADQLNISSGAQIRSATAASGDANNITLLIEDNLTLTGANTGLFANTEPGSSGRSGSIIIDPISVIIADGASIAVDSQGTGIGGTVDLSGVDLTLNNGTILAETNNSLGGNISLEISNIIRLQNNSLISATAGRTQTGGDGGNITIEAPLIVALSQGNNDITANAFSGKGGQIQISTQGLFGFDVREQLTPANDITTSSELGVDGTITINNPDVNPNQGLIDLPQVPVEAQISQSCQPGVATTGQFVSTGRGGIPPHPYEPLSSDEILGDIYPPAQMAEHALRATEHTVIPIGILEARGWSMQENGTINLVAETPKQGIGCQLHSGAQSQTSLHLASGLQGTHRTNEGD